MIHDGPAIHDLAHVDRKTCSLGDGTFVWQFASVIRGARIGQCCSIGAGAIVDGAWVGDESLIGAGAQLHPGTRVGRAVFVGPGVICCNDVWPRASKEGFDQAALQTRPTVVIGDGASVGAGAILLPGCVVQPGAMVAAGVVTKDDVPAGHMLRRDGSLMAVPPDGGASRRMRWAM